MGFGMRVVLAAVLCGSFCAGARAADLQDTAGAMNPQELEAFVDGLMHAYLDDLQIAGGVVAVVKDGQLYFSKGYGYSDVEEKTEVSPNTTLFRIGSVSKLFVWTSVMQLAEAGKLDLNADINTYLRDFQIPKRYDQPITMADLMTHTPGFEDNPIALFAKSPDKLEPLGDLLARTIPRRVRPPHEVASYSNYGTALAGHIIEEISGLSFDEYVEANIFEPLDMAHTTFRQPLPEGMAADMSKGYRFERRFIEEPFEYVPIAPAGAVSSTADDMANFMIAHLQYGRFGERRILEEDTARLMQSDLFQHSPGVSPMAHGFMVFDMNNQRVVGHGGDTLWFHTILAMLPEHNLGFFASFNSAGGGRRPASSRKRSWIATFRSKTPSRSKRRQSSRRGPTAMRGGIARTASATRRWRSSAH